MTNPSPRALEIAQLAAPDSCEASQKIIALQIEIYAREYATDIIKKVQEGFKND